MSNLHAKAPRGSFSIDKELYLKNTYVLGADFKSVNLRQIEVWILTDFDTAGTKNLSCLFFQKKANS